MREFRNKKDKGRQRERERKIIEREETNKERQKLEIVRLR